MTKILNMSGNELKIAQVSKLGIFLRVSVLAFLLVSIGNNCTYAQIPSNLTDKVYQGQGTINLLKDISGAQLQQYINTYGRFLLGADIIENAAGNETSDSIGVAIKQIELKITTSQGVFTFNDFFTSTTAMIKEAGSSTASQYYTLFGQTGSSQINSGTSGFDLSKFDDVIQIRNISVAGTIIGAELNVSFLNTAKISQQANETFFDYSGGFEDFALLNLEDAKKLEAANIGVAAAGSTVTYTAATTDLTAQTTTANTTEPVPTTTTTTTNTNQTASTSTTTATVNEGLLPTGPAAAPAAPAPPLMVLVALGMLVLLRNRVDGSA